jgi:hypothetical protein
MVGGKSRDNSVPATKPGAYALAVTVLPASRRASAQVSKRLHAFDWA